MASSHRKDNGHSMSMSESPQFFQIILPGTLRDGKLGIPTKFVKKYGNGLSSPALLRVPNGEVWKVELKKCDGKVWLKNGWQEFSNQYSLEYGHFLLFRYEGNCEFHVVIFDRSASEIKYPCTSNNHGQHEEPREQKTEESEDDGSIQILEDFSSSRKMREKSHMPCPRPHKMMRATYSANRNDSNLKSESLASQVRHNGSPARKGDKSTTNRCQIQNLKADNSAKALQRARAFNPGHDTALQRAKAFKSENLYFLVEMQPSYINPGRKVSLPPNFITKCLTEKVGDLTLCTLDGRTWPAKYCRYEIHNKYTKAALHCGWMEFRQDNKLEPGDVCVFELIEQTKILLKVIIYRVNENCCSSLGGINSLATCDDERLLTQGSTRPNHHLMRPLTSLEKSRARIRASNFRSENPFFEVVMQPAYLGVRCCVYIPYGFARMYFHEKDQVILQVSDGRTWIVKFAVTVVASGQKKARFYGGWQAFARDNNLKVGDVCIFELINRNETSFRVSIF